MSDAISSDMPAAGRSLSGWLKGTLLITLALVVSWGGAISYWRTTDHMPTTWELALFLLGLPVFVLFAFCFSRRLLARRDVASFAAVQAAKDSAAAPEVPGLAILAASLRLPHGTSAGELAGAIASNKARPDLDPELFDEEGFPVMTARSSDAVDEALQEEIAEWFGGNGVSTQSFSDEQWRALTLASSVTEELAGQARNELHSTAGSPPKVTLIPILPAEWSTEVRRAVGAWLKHEIAQFGWPDKDIALDEEGLASVEVMTPSAVFGRLERDAATVDAALVAIVVACASTIGNETIANWATNGTLFTSSNSKGKIPGEGAAGLLISDLRQAPPAREDSFVVLDGMSEDRLGASADEAKRVDPKLVRELAERVLKRAAADFADMAKIVADTDHRSNRMLELMSIAATQMPHLDEADDVIRVSISTGSCGEVPFIAALALAHHYVLAHQLPVLAISNRDAYRRAAALIKPAGLSS